MQNRSRWEDPAEIPNAATGEVPGGWNGLTAVTVAPDGAVFAAMGYGSQLIHKFDASGKLLKTFGAKGNGDGQFNTCHGLTIDTRFGAPRLLVADRGNRRLCHLDLEGNWIGVHASNLRLPCSFSWHGEYLAVAELEARAVILDKSGTPVAFLGDNPDRKQWANFGVKPEATAPRHLHRAARHRLRGKRRPLRPGLEPDRPRDEAAEEVSRVTWTRPRR